MTRVDSGSDTDCKSALADRFYVLPLMPYARFLQAEQLVDGTNQIDGTSAAGEVTASAVCVGK